MEEKEDLLINNGVNSRHKNGVFINLNTLILERGIIRVRW